MNLKAMSGFLALNQLEDLNLSRNDLSDDGITSLRNLKKLVRLDITDTRVTTKGLRQLASLPKLKTLTFRSSAIGTNDLADLRKKFPKVNFQNDTRTTAL